MGPLEEAGAPEQEQKGPLWRLRSPWGPCTVGPHWPDAPVSKNSSYVYGAINPESRMSGLLCTRSVCESPGRIVSASFLNMDGSRIFREIERLGCNIGALLPLSTYYLGFSAYYFRPFCHFREEFHSLLSDVQARSLTLLAGSTIQLSVWRLSAAGLKHHSPEI